jgi:threonine/homoserine/homoserine lactone efflux protein
MGLETLLGFFIASVLLALVPGPDNIFVITHAMSRGFQAGLAVVAGLCTGLLVHTGAVVLGIAVIFQTSDWAFAALKTTGAAYLLYLAWQAFFSSGPQQSNTTGHPPSLVWSYRRGIIMNITNPKVSLFFLAFLPQFVAPESGAVSAQILLLGALFIAATILVFSSLALLAGRVARMLEQSPIWQQSLNRLAGLVFVGLALHLLLADAAV